MKITLGTIHAAVSTSDPGIVGALYRSGSDVLINRSSMKLKQLIDAQDAPYRLAFGAVWQAYVERQQLQNQIQNLERKLLS